MIPEFKAEFESVAGKWQDIVEDVLGEKEDDFVEERRKNLNHQRQRRKYQMMENMKRRQQKLRQKN